MLQHNNLMVPTTEMFQSKIKINAIPNEATQELWDLLSALSSKDWFPGYYVKKVNTWQINYAKIIQALLMATGLSWAHCFQSLPKLTWTRTIELQLHITEPQNNSLMKKVCWWMHRSIIFDNELLCHQGTSKTFFIQEFQKQLLNNFL